MFSYETLIKFFCIKTRATLKPGNRNPAQDDLCPAFMELHVELIVLLSLCLFHMF